MRRARHGRGIGRADRNERPRVLVVADEPSIVLLAETHLQSAGFEVHSAPNSTDAIRLTTGGNSGLLVLDLSLPGESRWDVLRELRRLDSDLPVLISSGYLMSPASKHGVLDFCRSGTTARA